MANSYQKPSSSQGAVAAARRGVLPIPVSLRTMAILLMVAGAAGFILSLVIYGEQILCLLGSTLLTFIGLALTIAARQYREARGREVETTGEPVLVGEDPQLQLQVDQAEQKPPIEAESGEGQMLTELAVDSFRRCGAQVEVENQRKGRSILHVQAASGKSYMALVLEYEELIERADVRALFALMISTGSQGGFVISQGKYTSQAEEWVRHRRIVLVNREGLHESIL